MLRYELKTRMLIAGLLAALLLGACAPAQPSATATATIDPGTATPTMEPTRTPLRTATPTATPTALPPATLRFDVVQTNTRDDLALSAPTGDEWEGDYTWVPYGVYYQGTYYLFYNGYDNIPVGIGLATSTDGFHYTRYSGNPIMEPESTRTMRIGPVVYVQDDGTWVMYLVEDVQRSNLAGDSIVRYTAPAPTGPWTASNAGEPVYAAEEGAWNDRMVVRSILFVEDEIWLAFQARHTDRTVDIGILTSSDGGMHFELLVDEPVLSPGPEGAWDGFAAGTPMLFATEDGFEMFYLGLVPRSSGVLSSYEGNNLFFGYATSPDGIHWTKEPHNPVLQVPAAAGFSYSAAMKLDGVYYIYYVYDAGAGGLGVVSFTLEEIN